MVFRFADRDMMMRYHWGHGVGHKYTFTSGLQQEDLQDGDDIQPDFGCTSDAAKADDGPNDDLSELSLSDDGLQDDCVDCEAAPGGDSDEDLYLVNAMYNSDQDELGEHYEF